MLELLLELASIFYYKNELYVVSFFMTRRITSDSQDVGLITINGNKKRVITLVKFKSLKYLVNSVQDAHAKCFCGSHFRIWNLANNMKKQNKKHQNAKDINESDVFILFARFQISICELQSIWRKLLVLSWLYHHINYPLWSRGKRGSKLGKI